MAACTRISLRKFLLICLLWRIFLTEDVIQPYSKKELYKPGVFRSLYGYCSNSYQCIFTPIRVSLTRLTFHCKIKHLVRKDYKNGFTTPALPARIYIVDLTVCIDVASNPGPEYPKIIDISESNVAFAFNYPAKNNNGTIAYSRKQLLNLKRKYFLSSDVYSTLKQIGILKTRRVRAGKKVKAKIYKIPTWISTKAINLYSRSNPSKLKLAYYGNVNKHSLAVPDHDPPTETTICMDISLNPGTHKIPNRITVNSRPKFSRQCFVNNDTQFTASVSKISSRNLNNLTSVPIVKDTLRSMHKSKCLNFSSLNARSVRNKTLTIKDFVVEQDIDVMAITETWLRETGDELIIAELCPTGYKLIHIPRLGNSGGGVGLLYKDSIAVKHSHQRKFRSFEYLDISLGNLKIVRTILIYRPPSSGTNGLSVSLFYEEFTNLLEDVAVSPSEILLVGDFNFHIDDQNDMSAKRFIDIIESFNFKQLVNQPTHCCGHILDLVFVRSDVDDSFLSNLRVIDQSISDHSAVNFCLNLAKPPHRKKRITCRKIKDIDFEALNNDICNSDLLKNTNDISLAVSEFEEVLSSLLNKYAPIKQRTIIIRPKAPWYCADIIDAKQIRRKLERKWRSTKLVSDRIAFSNQCRVVNEMIYKSKQAYYTSLIKNNATNSKLLFRTVNKLLQKNSEQLYPKAADDKNLANSFADFFVTKIENIQLEIRRVQSDYDLSLQTEDKAASSFSSFRPVTDSDVLKLLSCSKIKSCPLDPIPASVLKECSSTLLPAYTRLINLSLMSGTMPETLKIAMLSPLLKSVNADHDSFSSFRPISNLKFLSKLIEKAVFSQLNEYLLENDLHEVFQSAYKVYHSSETALLRVHNDILQSLDKKQSVILGFLDLSAAFDTVNHDILFCRLATRFGITGTVLCWFESYLSSRTQFVKINESSSSTRNLKTGVPQGSVLGPVLYLLYTAPIADIIKRHNFNYHIYADDTQLYISFEADCNLDSVKSRIENCISDIYRWMILNGLKLNQDKTIFSLIHSKFRPRPQLDHIQVGNELIPFSTSATNLGVIFDETLTFEEHVKKICRSSFFHLRNISRIRKYLTMSSVEVLIHAFVSSKLDYCNSLLYGLPKSLLQKLQSVQNSAARIVTLKPKYDHITPVLIQLHWLPINFRIVFKILLLVYKSLNGFCPIYLTNLLYHRKSTRCLRSISNELLLVPSSNYKTYGDRSFSVCAPKLWNSLPYSLRKSSSLVIFKKQLKTYLFNIFINGSSLYFSSK